MFEIKIYECDVWTCGRAYASARGEYRVWRGREVGEVREVRGGRGWGREARQRAHDLGGGEHADVRVRLQEPARRHRHVGRAHRADRGAAGRRAGRGAGRRAGRGAGRGAGRRTGRHGRTGRGAGRRG